MVWDLKDVKNSSLKSSSRSTYLENSQCLEVPLRSYGECPWMSFLPGDFRCIFILSPSGVTILAELNSLVCSNQKLLCSLFHKCSAGTLLELLENKMYLGATLGIIQVLHTWGQELNYYPYIHCINILLIPKEL